MSEAMLCVRCGEVRAIVVVADDDLFRETIAEWAMDPATEAIIRTDIETARASLLRPAADLIKQNQSCDTREMAP
ncbi:hypothetical protein [Rhizobium sp. 18065]|uniref:hypothetical protein n=1 Tax=Rhizobium sp. 18065 TaxID=2681411 RepID=UPI001357FF99|nr:hypothetical protein [Rhizobium sp. 18065]